MADNGKVNGNFVKYAGLGITILGIMFSIGKVWADVAYNKAEIAQVKQESKIRQDAVTTLNAQMVEVRGDLSEMRIEQREQRQILMQIYNKVS